MVAARAPLTVSERSAPEAWNGAVAARAAGTFFHRYEWCRLMESLPGVRFHPCWVEGGGADAVPLPAFEQDGRWSWSLLGYGGPCPADGERLGFAALEAAMAPFQGTPTTRVALPPGEACFDDLDRAPGWRLRTVHLLPLDGGFDGFWRRCTGTARTGVRYAGRRGVEVAALDGRRDLAAFERLYREQMCRLEAAYLLPPELLRALPAALGPALLGLGAHAAGRLVAGALFLVDAERGAAFHWIQVVSDAGRYLQAGYALLAAGVAAVVERGCRRLDMGSSHRPSVARHKELWGARAATHAQYER